MNMKTANLLMNGRMLMYVQCVLGVAARGLGEDMDRETGGC